MQQVGLDQASHDLRSLVRQALGGEEIVITEDGHPLARLVPFRPPGWKREAGRAEGQVWMADGFDEPLDDFQDYST